MTSTDTTRAAEIDYTTVIGLDAQHLRELSITWPTWKRHKPELLQRPMVAFYDHEQVNEFNIREVVDHPDLKLVRWPNYSNITYDGPVGKWTDPQRYKMLAGFVYVPPLAVGTQWWLKLDTDVIATGHPAWIDPAWFEDRPAIAAQAWGLTKPPDQILELDAWAARVSRQLNVLNDTRPLSIAPEPGATKVKHPRIISWCGFFNLQFSAVALALAGATCGYGHLPVRSQDGYHWYLATRLGLPVHRVQMKSLGWEHWHTMDNIRNAAARAMRT